MLGGVFGYGLKRNVLDIYKFACRNYEDGDDIYAFGFSRGAFTARLVVALIAHQGLVQSNDEGELDRTEPAGVSRSSAAAGCRAGCSGRRRWSARSAT